MLKKVALGFFAVIAVVLIYAGVKPADYVVSRSIEISASDQKIFPYLNNQKLAEKWGPWSEVDPGAKMEYSGPDEGVGAKASWNSRGQLGVGSATITESIPNQKVRIALAYTEPMTMTQTSDYLLEAVPTGGTRVTWRVEGQVNYIGRVMGLFFNMDKIVGDMFEKGLANLKRLVEAAP